VKIKDRPEFANKTPAFALRGEETVSIAVKAMAEMNIGSVVIVDDNMKVLGIVTERDLVRRFLGQNIDPNTTALSSIMTTNIKTARLDDDDMECLRLMSDGRFRHLPVVDESGHLINILSQGDFVAQTWQELLLLLVSRKTSETLRVPSVQVVGALLLYTLAIIAMSDLWKDFSFR
jgi:CBS domain-containing protein